MIRSGRIRARERTERKAADRSGGVDDHHPPWTVHLGRGRGELPHPHQVEQDVQRAAVQPAGAEHRPPTPQAEDRQGPAGAEEKQGGRGWCHERHRSAHAHRAARKDERQPVQDDARADDERHEAQVAPQQTQGGAEAPQAGVAAPAVVAGGVVGAHQHAAGAAEQGTCSLACEHGVDDSLLERHASYRRHHRSHGVRLRRARPRAPARGGRGVAPRHHQMGRAYAAARNAGTRRNTSSRWPPGATTRPTWEQPSPAARSRPTG